MAGSTALWMIRRALILIAAAIVVLFARPASATTPTPSNAETALVAWARHEALPRLALRALAAPEQDQPLHALGETLAAAIAESGRTGRFDVATLTDRNPAFWAAAGSTPRDLQFVLAVKTTLLLADGRLDAAARHYQLASLIRLADAPGGRTLGELASAIGWRTTPGDATDLLHDADAALDEQDWGLAALGYRLALLHAPPTASAERDLPGHYLYCLHRLGVSQPMSAARGRFYRNVVFPVIQTQSRQRVAMRSDLASAPIERP